MSKGTNFKIVSVTNPETDETLDLYVRYNWYYDPGQMYMPNGDPGYPSESEINIQDYHISEEPNSPIPNWVDDKIVEEAIWEAGDVFMQDSDYEFEY